MLSPETPRSGRIVRFAQARSSRPAAPGRARSRGVRVPPRTHHEERLTCGYTMGRYSSDSGTRLFPQVRIMGVQVGARLRNGNTHRQPDGPADFA